MTRFLVTLLMSTAITVPALAEGMAQDLGCGTFTTMSRDDQMSAMHDAMASDDAMAVSDAAATVGAMASDDAMASDPTMASDEAMAAVLTTCNANPDMMLTDAIHPAN